MALTSVEQVLIKPMGGSKVWVEFEEDVSKGDVVVIKTDRKFAQSDADKIAIGIALEDIDVSVKSHGPMWVGKGILWAKAATGQTVGAGQTAGASGAFAAGTEGTHHISAILWDDTALDTDYFKVLLL